ncbi:aminoglycoside phosphotransferase family protein [Blastococcus brunescens]|uniref:Aminoglycoside phosphotransferase family protein n=1 Tax=Blastococcus brunescens TaxID=1564165 RepID=A0ABZ1BC02_9ACTN|nr:aminoglycoside phosphotransferase family protein [Blastococcus sp. BMG 8361]WRL66925.1 aminoglycoside phosphotransferase family protein [Blastococcus sp. BMG 8361]
MPGRPLYELLDTPAAVTACRALGTALAALHAAPVPHGTPVHDAAAEVAVLRRWTDLSRTWGAADVPGVEEVVRALAVAPAGPPVLLHRDLHDRQVLVADNGSVGLLDFDLLAAGEPAVDLANLLVHLELREHQGLLPDAGCCAPRCSRRTAPPRPRSPAYPPTRRRPGGGSPPSTPSALARRSAEAPRPWETAHTGSGHLDDTDDGAPG